MRISTDSKESREVINHGQICRYFMVRWTLLFKSLAIIEEENKSIYYCSALHSPCLRLNLNVLMPYGDVYTSIFLLLCTFWLLAASLSVFQLKFPPWQNQITCRFDLIYVSFKQRLIFNIPLEKKVAFMTRLLKENSGKTSNNST